MFGDILTVADTVLITLVGMGTVFFVLVLLTIILSLFRFIPGEKVAMIAPTNTEIVAPTVTTSQAHSTIVDPLHKAIIVAAILENLEITVKSTQVRITNIRKIS